VLLRTSDGDFGEDEGANETCKGDCVGCVDDGDMNAAEGDSNDSEYDDFERESSRRKRRIRAEVKTMKRKRRLIKAGMSGGGPG